VVQWSSRRHTVTLGGDYSAVMTANPTAKTKISPGKAVVFEAT